MNLQNRVKDEFRHKIGWIVPFLFIAVVISFALGFFISDSTNDTAGKIEAIAALFSAVVAFCGLIFAISIFDHNYETSDRLVCKFNDLKDSPYVVNFVNESRIIVHPPDF